jgi:mannan endo-1,4-beta-mannosidase
MLPGGADHEFFKGRLRRVRDVFNQFVDDNGKVFPVIFRPFHEMNGSWFWWGRRHCTADEYKRLFRFTVTYLRDTLGLHQLLYAFAPDATGQLLNNIRDPEDLLDRYPGDDYVDYVDVVGIDDYADFERGNLDSAAETANAIGEFARQRKKVAAFTELGYRDTPKPKDVFRKYFLKTLKGAQANIAYIMFWHNTASGGEWQLPSPRDKEADDLRAFCASRFTKLQGDLPGRSSILYRLYPQSWRT